MIALTDDSAIALGHIRRTPAYIQMMHRHKQRLDVGASSHLCSAAQQHTHLSAAYLGEKFCFLVLCICVVDKGEYSICNTVMEMYGVGPSLGPQLMAEIGDIRRFSSKKLLIAFAGIEPQPNDSGKIVGNDSGISKVGSAVLRRTLFLIMTVILKTQPQDEPVFQFMNKKRSEGKPYKVYMMASANKFLRIYYARVKAVMDSKHSK